MGGLLASHTFFNPHWGKSRSDCSADHTLLAPEGISRALTAVLLATDDQAKTITRSKHAAMMEMPQCAKTIHSAIATIMTFSVSDTKPRGTRLEPPTQAHLMSRLSI